MRQPTPLLPSMITACGLCLALAAHATGVADAETEIPRFMQAPGYAARDVDAVEERLRAHFAKHQPRSITPGADVTPVEKALLLVDLMEPALPRTRTIVRYGLVHENPAADRFTPYAFVTVERYNLGPALHQQLQREHGVGAVAAPKDFGVGPHVAWRFVSRPMMGSTASLLELARREIPPAEAARADCDGRPCLSLEHPLDELRRWREGAQAPGAFRSPYRESAPDGLSSAARAAAELLVAAGLAQVEPDLQGRNPRLVAHEPERPEAARGSQPYLFVTLERNLAQDTGLDAVLHQRLLNDDAVREQWQRRVQTPEGRHFMHSMQSRR